MATPHVSGVISLLNKYYPTLSALELKDCVLGSCDRFWEEQESGMGFVAYNPQIFGQGRVNAVKAFRLADSMSQAKAAADLAKQLPAPVAA